MGKHSASDEKLRVPLLMRPKAVPQAPPKRTNANNQYR